MASTIENAIRDAITKHHLLYDHDYSVTELPLRKTVPPIGIIVNVVLRKMPTSVTEIGALTSGAIHRLSACCAVLAEIAMIAVQLSTVGEDGQPHRLLRVETAIADLARLPSRPADLLDRSRWNVPSQNCVWYQDLSFDSATQRT